VIMIELTLPLLEHRRLFANMKMYYRDVVIEISRSKSIGVTRIFLEDTPKGWWLATRLLRKYPGKLYKLQETKYIDIPSKIMELSRKRWNPKMNEEIERALKEWGVMR